MLEEGLAAVVDEDEEDTLDSGDFPGFLGCGATIIPPVTGWTGAGLPLPLIGEADLATYDTQSTTERGKSPEEILVTFFKLQLSLIFSLIGVELLSISKL